MAHLSLPFLHLYKYILHLMGYLCPTSCINGCRTKKNNSAQPTNRCLVRKRKGPFFCKHSYIRWGHRQPARADFFTLFSSQPFYEEVSRRAIFSFRCVCRRFAISFGENCKGLAVRPTGRRTGARSCRQACGPAAGFRPLPSASTPSAAGPRGDHGQRQSA